MAVQNYYLDVTVAPTTNTGVGFTSSDGIGYAVVNGRLAKTSQAETKTDTLTITTAWYNAASGVAERRVLTDAEKANISAKGSGSRIQFTLSGESVSRVRLGKSDTISSQTLKGPLSIYAQIAEGGGVTFYDALSDGNLVTVYYSLAGQLASAADAASDWGATAGLNENDDLSSTLLDAHYLGTTVNPDAASGSEATWNTTHAADLLKINIA